MITFNTIPNNARVPGPYVEVDNRLAVQGLIQLQTRILVLGQRLASGTVLAGVPTQIFSKPQGMDAFGRGSMLSHMIDKIIDNNSSIEIWAVALDDAGGGVAATGTFTVTGTATETGVITAYIAGTKVEAVVTSGDAQNAIANALAAAINANADLPVTAGVSTNVVTVTARNKGTPGNDIDLRLNYYGKASNEKLPAGVNVVIVAMASGATNPDVATAIASLPEEVFDVWIGAYTDTSNIVKIETELDRRWGPTVMLEGHYVAAMRDTVGNLTTFGNGRNKPTVTVWDSNNNSPASSYLFAAAAGAQMAFSVGNDPARPFNTLELVGILPAPVQNRRSYVERNALLFAGIATHKVARGGVVQLERGITNYKTNSGGSPDPSYLDSQTRFTLAFYRQTLRARITQKFPRHKLADDGTNFGQGQAIVTPSIIKAEIVALAGLWEEAGLLEGLELFKKVLIVERNTTDRTRIDCVIPPDVVNQFNIFAASLMFRL